MREKWGEKVTKGKERLRREEEHFLLDIRGATERKRSLYLAFYYALSMTKETCWREFSIYLIRGREKDTNNYSTLPNVPKTVPTSRLREREEREHSC